MRALAAAIAAMLLAPWVPGCDHAVLESVYESRVVAVDGDRLTVTPTQATGDAAQPKTLRVDAKASITRNGKGARLDELQPGDYVNLTTREVRSESVVTEIDARARESNAKES